jgi:steroid 5-alpha reductase family enzyme
MLTRMNRTQSLARVLGVYVVAFSIFAAWLAAGPRTGFLWLDGLIADLLATLVVFIASRRHHNSSMYDAYWSVLPPALAIGWWIRSEAPVDDVRAWLVLLLILVWAIRLTGNWVHTFPGLHHEDWRYSMLRENAGRFEFMVDLMAIHVIPTLQVFAGMLPVYVVLTQRDRGLGWLDVVAFVVGIGAVVLELVADVQLHRFAAAKRAGEVMDRGLWSWSRHPNYFGEFSFWLALAQFGLAAAPGTWWWIFVGALLMLAMFQGASIPMMEKRSLERRPSYQQVIDRVGRFVPRPPRSPST